MSTPYDAVVVGGRCAGAPTAMLLARKGHRVLLVDRARFPSDTVSTHFVHPPGVAALGRWGLRDRLEQTGCPPISEYSFDFGFFTISGSPRPSGNEATAFCPRRTALDALLVEAAAEAGVEVRTGFGVEAVLIEDGTVVGIRGKEAGGAATTERARVVIGADGRNSFIARAVRAPRYNEKPAVGPAMYSYFEGVESLGFDVSIREECAFAAFPTHDDLTLIIAGTTTEQFASWRDDMEGNFMKVVDLSARLGPQVRDAKRVERFHTATDLPGFFRKPFGPGWALVGDAGYHKHPVTAQGMTDAFVDAERLTDALDAAFSGRETFDVAMAAYQRERDEHAMAMYEMTFEFATMAPPPPEQQQLLAAVAGNAGAMDQFVSVQAGTLPIPEFFAPENVARIMGTTTPPPAAS